MNNLDQSAGQYSRRQGGIAEDVFEIQDHPRSERVSRRAQAAGEVGSARNTSGGAAAPNSVLSRLSAHFLQRL